MTFLLFAFAGIVALSILAGLLQMLFDAVNGTDATAPGPTAPKARPPAGRQTSRPEQGS